MATYGIGQIISSFTGNNSYLNKITNITCNPYFVTGINSSKTYKDYYIKPTTSNFHFDPSTAYYLKVHVGRNTFFDLNLQIKLVQQEANQSIDLTDCYQIVRKVIIPRAGNGDIGTTKIILFDNPHKKSEEILVRKVGDTSVNFYVIEDSESPDSYYCYDKTKTTPYQKEQITKGSDLTLAHNWKQSESDQFFDIEVIFSPRESNFNAIFLQLDRTQLDDDLYIGKNEKEQTIYGLTLGDLTTEDIELCTLKNLVTAENKESFSTIGVWGNPGLIMAINGEEIKIGSNRYYELNDFEITSLGIVAKDKNDSFSIDYQFRQ